VRSAEPSIDGFPVDEIVCSRPYAR
jgi:hypothetical protein